MTSFDAVAAKVADGSGASAGDVKRAALLAARGASYTELSKFLPLTDISVHVTRFPAGLSFLSITDISVSDFDRPVHSRDSKGVRRARSNGHSVRKAVR